MEFYYFRTMNLKETSPVPSRNADYKEVSYWDQRYTREPHYEWLAGFGALRPLVEATLDRLGPTARILQLGCGNSDLAIDLHDAGFEHVVNIDISAVCVANMRLKHPELTFVEMDMTQLDFPSDSFDLVVEKATLDSLLVDCESPWSLESPGHRLVSRALREVKRVLRPAGAFLSITFAQPHHRVPLLTQPGLRWAVQVDKLNGVGGMVDYYVMRMEEGGEGAGEEALRRFGIGKVQYGVRLVLS
jgi:endothelin-converting enzyme